MPDTGSSWPQPTDSTLQACASRILSYDDAIRQFDKQLAIEKDIVAIISTDNARAAAYEQSMAVLNIAKVRLGELVDFDTRILEKQIEKPNLALGRWAERVNEQMEEGLKEVGDALGEVQYLIYIVKRKRPWAPSNFSGYPL
jgi:hypothetical protein